MNELNKSAESQMVLATYLAKLLGDTVSYGFVAQGYHWNVQGINFHQFHEFFGEIYEDAQGSVDKIGESIRQLNFDSPFQLAEFQQLATPFYVCSSNDAYEMTKSLYQGNEVIRTCLIRGMLIADSVGEQGIYNFLADRFDSHSKYQWQMRSILGDAIADIYEIDVEAVTDSFLNPNYDVEQSLYKAKAEQGDFVRWNSGTGKAQGKVVRVVTDGVINVPDSSFEVNGSEENPALLIRIYEETEDGWKPTEVQVGHRASTVNVIEPLEKAETYTPPKGVQEEAQRALEWMKEGLAGANFTDVGRRRASQLANGQAVSLQTIRRMNSFLARHERSSKGGQGFDRGEEGYPSAGRVAWAAWGGDPAISWVRGILDGVDGE